jgi:LysM repeat protein
MIYNIKHVVFVLSCFLCLGVLCPLQVKGQKKVEKTVKYTVQPGETILGIAHRHGTTLDHLLSLNPGVQPDYVQAGQVVIVPYVPGGAEPAPTPAQRAAAARATEKNVVVKKQPAAGNAAIMPNAVSKVSYAEVGQQPQPVKVTYKEYKAKKKETAYGIAKANNITVDELIEANPEMKQEGYKLKKGSVLRIPVKPIVKKPTFKGLNTIRLAVILPLVGNGVEFDRSVEFYRGLLMGVEELKQAGVNVVVSVYNEPAPDVSIASQMLQVVGQNPDVIVGPLYPTHFTDVTAVSAKKVKVVVPFSSKVPQVDYRPEVYVLNTPAVYENALALDLFMTNFKKQTHVILLHGQAGNKRSFSEELQRRLSSAGYDIVSLPTSASTQQMTAALLGKKQGEYIIVPDDASEATMKQMLTKTADLQHALSGAQISLLGYESWLPYAEGSMREQIHAANTYILTPNYYYPYTTASKAFYDKYRKWFKADFVSSKPRMAPLGYDFARGFLGSMATYGYDFSTQSPQKGSVAAQPKLQSEPRFITVGGNGGYVSRSMWLVRFKRDMSIVKISAQ